jgi:hypothetical protein
MFDFPLEDGEDARVIEGFPNYWVTSHGRVISGPLLKRRGFRSLKSILNKGKGYLGVRLFREGRSYSREIAPLVARAFIPNPSNLPTVNHIRGEEKTNNRVDNLEWATNKKQTTHALETGLYHLSEDWGIKEDRRFNLLKPFQLRLSLPGDKLSKYIGMFATREDARIVRDKICEERGLVRPIGV